MKSAAILIRGRIGVSPDIKKTLDNLRLRKKHTCSIIELTPTTKGQLQKAKDYITYGEVTEETIKLLEEKRKKVSPENSKIKTYTLNPPKGGFERKGIKKSYKEGGALGYRGKAINELIKKMV